MYYGLDQLISAYLSTHKAQNLSAQWTGGWNIPAHDSASESKEGSSTLPWKQGRIGLGPMWITQLIEHTARERKKYGMTNSVDTGHQFRVHHCSFSTDCKLRVTAYTVSADQIAKEQLSQRESYSQAFPLSQRLGRKWFDLELGVTDSWPVPLWRQTILAELYSQGSLSQFEGP